MNENIKTSHGVIVEKYLMAICETAYISGRPSRFVPIVPRECSELTMAKKTSRPKLALNLDSSFQIKISADRKQTFDSDLKRGELSLSLAIEYGDGILYLCEVYPNGFKSGSSVFKHTGEGLCDVTVKGDCEIDLDESFDQELIDAVKDKSHLAVQLSVVTDSAPNRYYVDDIEDNTIVIGQATIAQ